MLRKVVEIIEDTDKVENFLTKVYSMDEFWINQYDAKTKTESKRRDLSK